MEISDSSHRALKHRVLKDLNQFDKQLKQLLVDDFAKNPAGNPKDLQNDTGDRTQYYHSLFCSLSACRQILKSQLFKVVDEKTRLKVLGPYSSVDELEMHVDNFFDESISGKDNLQILHFNVSEVSGGWMASVLYSYEITKGPQ